MWKLREGKYILAGEREKKMRTMSGRGGNITSSVIRICSNTQGTHSSRSGGVRKNKPEGEGMVKRRGKKKEKKNNRSVEWNINKYIKDTQ